MKIQKTEWKEFEFFCSRVVMGIGILLMGALSAYSLRYTEQFLTNRTEAMEEIRDVMPVTLVLMVAVVSVLFFCARWILKKESTKKRNIRVLLIFTCVYTVVYGLCWVKLCKYYMIGDARLVSFFAEQLAIRIDDISASDIAYLTSYPHQIGLIAFVEPLYRLCGWENYHAFQALNAIGAAAVVFLGFQIVCEITVREEPGVYFLLLMLGCHPLLIYISFFYGEVLSVAFTFGAIYGMLRYMKEKRKRQVFGMAVSITVACLIRSNCYIVLAAIGCVMVVKTISERKVQYLLTVLICILTFSLTHTVLFESYERRLGIELDQGMPYSLWVAMGVQESNEGKEGGWFNNFATDVFIEQTGQDREEADQIAKTAIRESIQTFRENPTYALHFFRRKIVSQWNEPTYACLLETSRRVEARSELADRLYKGELWRPFTRLMDIYQSLIYCGTFLFLLLWIRRKIPVEKFCLFIIVLGGFLFYVIWEAKSRYIFPYFMMMIPMAACGYDMLLLQIRNITWRRPKTEKSQGGMVG